MAHVDLAGRIRDDVEALEREWADDARWRGIRRSYTARDVVRLRGSVRIQQTLATVGAARLWHLVQTREYVGALGALTGNQAVQIVKAGVPAVYVSGWQVAADNNQSGQMYPDLGLYPATSAAAVVRQINNALLRADQIEWAEGRAETHWLAPVVADAEAGFGGPLNAFELMKAMIEAGAAGVHFEDQLASEKKCGHMGGKVVVPTSQFIRTLTAARLAADVLGVPTILIARTDALGATLLTSDVDPRDRGFLTGARTPEGYWVVTPGLDAAIARALAYAPYADGLWFETAKPDLEEASRFAATVHEQFPGKLLAYNCSPSFNWKRHLDDAEIASFQHALAAMGYRFQFITLAGFHTLNASMFELARGYADRGMPAFVQVQEHEFELERVGYTAAKHQREVGAGYFDAVAEVITGGESSTLALRGSTEEEQFTAASAESLRARTRPRRVSGGGAEEGPAAAPEPRPPSPTGGPERCAT
jgi:isocitrate lyase